MKRVVCFITSLTSGGAEHQLALLSVFLAEKGYDVTLTTFGDSKDHYHVNAKVKRYIIPHGKSNVSKLIAIWRYFLNVKTDCVISFGARENFFCLVPLWFRRRIKILAGERCVSWNGLAWYKKINYKWLYRRADFIVPNSYTQQEEIGESWPCYKNKVQVITNYTDTNDYSATSLPNNEPLKIGIFCRYTAQKNYRRFAKVVHELKEKCDTPFEIHWYGNMHLNHSLLPDYVEFEGLCHKYHIESSLYLHDHIQNVAEVLKNFDALCLPSLTEGFSNSISEYICSARPVLCSDVADNKVMVHDGKNGFLFNPEDIDDMVGAFIKYFSLDEDGRKAMGKESRRIAETLFDKNNFTESYISLIEH